jgi:hypothetical protein
MFKYDKYITNSLIITKYINKTYHHKNKCLLLTARFPKREIIQTQIEHTRYTISPKEFKSWVTRISFALLLCTTELSAVNYFAICS